MNYQSEKRREQIQRTNPANRSPRREEEEERKQDKEQERWEARKTAGQRRKREEDKLRTPSSKIFSNPIETLIQEEETKDTRRGGSEIGSDRRTSVFLYKRMKQRWTW